MKIMTYNILGEDDQRIPDALAAIKAVHPDFLAIQEANQFTKNENHYLHLFSKELGLPFYELSHATEHDYHVASFSKYPFKRVQKLKGFRNAALETIIMCELGEVSICNAHLTPYTEEERVVEVHRIIEAQKDSSQRIILGDLNSLSLHDNYSIDSIVINESQRRKFTNNGELQLQVTTVIEASGYIDAMYRAGMNHTNTVPTPVNADTAHGTMRLDYLFVSNSLIDCVKSVDVLKNELTNRASDHYPIVAELI